MRWILVLCLSFIGIGCSEEATTIYVERCGPLAGAGKFGVIISAKHIDSGDTMKP